MVGAVGIEPKAQRGHMPPNALSAVIRDLIIRVIARILIEEIKGVQTNLPPFDPRV